MASALARVFEDVPKAPKYNVLDFEEEQRKQAQANLNTLPYLMPLGRGINRFMAEETEASLRQALPGAYDQIQQNIKSALEGQLPEDVLEQRRRLGAELGIAQGTSGSKANQMGTLRDILQTSLQRTDFGMEAAQRWLQMARSPVFDISSGFVPIQQRMSIRLEEQKRLWERQWLRNKLSSIPQGAEAFAITALDEIQELAFSAASVYMGGMGGQQQQQQQQPRGGGGGGGGGGGYVDPWEEIMGGGWS